MDTDRLNRVVKEAAKYCGVENLAVQGLDSLDFHSIGVIGLKAALEYAYRSGYSEGKADGFERGLMIEVGN